jgi:folate-binding protein YgfZ
MPACLLPDRGLVSVSGPDSETFLDNLLTVSVEKLDEGEARFGALLTPQGKIIVDGFVVKANDGFLIDCPRALAQDLARRLGFYKLRAKVDVANRSEDYAVLAYWGDADAPKGAGLVFNDPRLDKLGERLIFSSDAVPDHAGTHVMYDAHRVALGVPEGGRDFAYGDAFPHEADMDQLHGVDFHKGCYVGQEVVSRMQHRAIARTRVVPVRFVEGVAALEGTEALSGGKVLGRMGSTGASGQALALLRLDRVSDAETSGEPLTAGGLAFKLERRDWIQFELPGTL